jgi:hypothetical protein
MDETIYFGRPGSMASLATPRNGIDGIRTRQVDTFELGNGGVRVSKLLGGRRRYQLKFASLDYATFAGLLGHDQGHQGSAAFALLDPGQRNQLTVNQSSATSETNGTDNFTVAGSGGTIASESVNVFRGPRSLRWSFSVSSPAAALLSLSSPTRDWPGIPVVSRPMCFWFYAKGGGADAITRLTAQMNWLGSTGTAISTSSGTPADTNSSSWTLYQVTATPPANSVYVNCSVSASGASIASGGVVYLDEFQLQEGSTPDSAWSPGTGVFPVVPVSLADTWSWPFPAYRDAPTLLLQEVGTQ